MHVEKTIISETELKLAIVVSEEELANIKIKVLIKLAKNLKVPGFRGGKIPPSLVEKNIDPTTLQTEFLDEAMTVFYAQATYQEKINPVTQPVVDIKKFVPFTVLEYEVKTEVIGPVTLGNYKGLKLKAVKKPVVKADVDVVLANIAVRMSERKIIDRASKVGDEVTIDFAGFDTAGKPIVNSDGKDYPLLLGSKQFIPGFEENLVGTKSGDKKSFDITFPKGYGSKDLAGKQAKFKVDIKSVSEVVKPKIDDKLAKKVGPFKDLVELKEDIKKQLEQESENEYDRSKQNEAVGMLSETSKVAIPQKLIDQQVVYETDDLRRNLTQSGQTYQEFLESEKTTEEKYKKEVIEPRAQEQLKIGIILSEIANKEALSVAPEELQAQIAALKAQYNDEQMREQLDKPESQRDIASRMLSQKVVNYVVAQSS